MLLGLDPVMRGEGASEVRRFVGMPSANGLRGAGRMMPRDAVRASIAHRVVNRRDAIPFLDRLAREIVLHSLAERMHHAAHLVAGHDAALAELAFPHMHFGAAYVGLRDLGDETTGGRLGNIVLVEFDLVRARNET